MMQCQNEVKEEMKSIEGWKEENEDIRKNVKEMNKMLISKIENMEI